MSNQIIAAMHATLLAAAAGRPVYLPRMNGKSGHGPEAALSAGARTRARFGQIVDLTFWPTRVVESDEIDAACDEVSARVHYWANWTCSQRLVYAGSAYAALDGVAITMRGRVGLRRYPAVGTEPCGGTQRFVGVAEALRDWGPVTHVPGPSAFDDVLGPGLCDPSADCSACGGDHEGTWHSPCAYDAPLAGTARYCFKPCRAEVLRAMARHLGGLDAARRAAPIARMHTRMRLAPSLCAATDRAAASLGAPYFAIHDRCPPPPPCGTRAEPDRACTACRRYASFWKRHRDIAPTSDSNASSLSCRDAACGRAHLLRAAEARLVAHVRSGELPRNVSSRASRAGRARAADARAFAAGERLRGERGGRCPREL